MTRKRRDLTPREVAMMVLCIQFHCNRGWIHFGSVNELHAESQRSGAVHVTLFELYHWRDKV